MDKIVTKLEEVIENYLKELSKSPVKTAIKTIAVIWIIGKIKSMLK